MLPLQISAGSFRTLGAGTLAFLAATALFALQPPAKAPAPPVKAPAVAPAPAAAPAAGKKEEKKIPDPEELTLKTRDDVQLKCTFFPGTLEKQAACVIMIPGWGGSRKEYDGIARVIQKMGHAVITVDPRGHGDSVVRRVQNGQDQKLDIAKMKPEIPAMITEDLEAVKSFLLEKNNAGELNIEELLVVGSQFGAILAVEWAGWDWHWPILPSKKQGQDVKAIALISPPATEQGKGMPNLLKSPIGTLGILIIAGKHGPKETGDAVRLHKALEKVHPVMPKNATPAVIMEKQSLFLSQPETKLQGTDLLKDPATFPGMVRDIASFLQLRVVNKAGDFPWAER